MARYVLVLVAAALTLGGCSTNAAEIAKELSKSDRSWCLSVTSIYGIMRVGGTGLASGTVTCSQEGMSVSAAAPVK